ncbi:MAG TPA: hypothetical protein VNM67_22100 [Thermoanaerobaculia bacterium]|jgi:hypothetical protein|nr:hypothetical protein [Thermoanaerobaculia bacterium]
MYARHRRESLLAVILIHIVAAAEAQALNITAGNAVDLGSSWAEITTAAVGPGENRFCRDGRLFFADGSGVLATDLDGQAVVWPNPQRSPNPRTFGYRETFPPAVIADNHLVKLKDGSLVHTVEAITWNDNVSPKPAWWDQTVEFPLKNEAHPGGRAIIYVRRSDDCGATWTRITDIDAATLTVPSSSGVPTKGLCGPPRLIQNPDKKSEGGGWDGHYLYADPYNGNLFLSTPCVFGTRVNREHFLVLLLMSSDRGGSWKVIGRLDTVNDWADAWRMPISSLPSGHVAFGYLNWQLNQLKVAILAPPYPLIDLTAKAAVLATFSPGELGPGAKVDTHVPGYPTLARNPGKGFLVTTPEWKPAGSGTKQAHRFFNVPITLPLPGMKKEFPEIEAPGLADMIHGTLIDGTPSTDLHAFYWVERSPVATTVEGQSQDALRVKFQVFQGNTAILKQPGVLTIADGKPYAYRADSFIGDYMGGASYAGKDGSQHFVAAWSEQGVLRFNTISLTPQILTVKVPVDLDVQIVPQTVPMQKLVKHAPLQVESEPARKPRP